MATGEFLVTFDQICRSVPLAVADLFLPHDFTFIGTGNNSFEVFYCPLDGKKQRAGYIFLEEKGVSLTAQPNDAGDILKKSWFTSFPSINPKRYVWRLFVPGIFARTIMGYIPDTQIGQCDYYDILDSKMGDQQFPQGTIAGKYQADELSNGSVLHLITWCLLDESGGLYSTIQHDRDILITNPNEWGA